MKRRRCQLAERRPARRLALAHRIAADIEVGRYKDYAEPHSQHRPAATGSPAPG